MNIIKITDNTGDSITMDSIEVTVDNTSITVDSNTSEVISSYFLNILPRFFADTVLLTLTNELTGEVTSLTCGATQEGNFLKISFGIEVEENTSFSATVTDLTEKLMWRGKVFATSQDNIQQYRVNVPDTNNVIIL